MANAGSDEDDFMSVKRLIPVDSELPEDMKAVASAGPQPKVIKGVGDTELVIDSKRREKLLKSKKKMLRLKGQGTKVVYDSDGNAHDIYELEDEEDFKARGPAEVQRAKFVEMEASKVKEADVEDKQLAKEKRREKKEKRKARERGDVDDNEEAPALYDEDSNAEDPLEFLKSLPLAGESEGEDEDEPPQKRAKKWFENESDDESKAAKKSKKSRGRIIEAADEPETLEDLEALAAGLLA